VKFNQRIVTKMPLDELWDDNGVFARERQRDLGPNDLRRLIQTSAVRFVIADCGLRLNWISEDKGFEIWKEIKSQIADPGKRIYLSQFPGETAFSASEWRGRAGECVVLLEKHH